MQSRKTPRAPFQKNLPSSHPMVSFLASRSLNSPTQATRHREIVHLRYHIVSSAAQKFCCRQEGLRRLQHARNHGLPCARLNFPTPLNNSTWIRKAPQSLHGSERALRVADPPQEDCACLSHRWRNLLMFATTHPRHWPITDSPLHRHTHPVIPIERRSRDEGPLFASNGGWPTLLPHRGSGCRF